MINMRERENSVDLTNQFPKYEAERGGRARDTAREQGEKTGRERRAKLKRQNQKTRVQQGVHHK